MRGEMEKEAPKKDGCRRIFMTSHMSLPPSHHKKKLEGIMAPPTIGWIMPKCATVISAYIYEYSPAKRQILEKKKRNFLNISSLIFSIW